jgi:hypothetical protein
VVIRLHTDPENRGTGAYQLLTPYTHGVPHVDCEGPSAVTRTNLLLPPGRKAPETRPLYNYLEITLSISALCISLISWDANTTVLHCCILYAVQGLFGLLAQPAASLQG